MCNSGCCKENWPLSLGLTDPVVARDDSIKFLTLALQAFDRLVVVLLFGSEHGQESALRLSEFESDFEKMGYGINLATQRKYTQGEPKGVSRLNVKSYIGLSIYTVQSRAQQDVFSVSLYDST